MTFVLQYFRMCPLSLHSWHDKFSWGFRLRELPASLLRRLCHSFRRHGVVPFLRLQQLGRSAIDWDPKGHPQTLRRPQWSRTRHDVRHGYCWQSCWKILRCWTIRSWLCIFRQSWTICPYAPSSTFCRRCLLLTVLRSWYSSSASQISRPCGFSLIRMVLCSSMLTWIKAQALMLLSFHSSLVGSGSSFTTFCTLLITRMANISSFLLYG